MCNPDEETTFGDWKDDMKQNSPTFDFWDKILHVELLVLVFFQSHREKNFTLCILEALAPWVFMLDHTNYARWLQVHIKDMKVLPCEIRDVFKKYWVFTKTKRKFSSMPLDQAHEQNNETVKGSGGANGTESPDSMKKWMVAVPEPILTEFEEQYHSLDQASQNHEQGYYTQEMFRKQVTNICDAIVTMGNPFMDTSH